MHGLVKAEMVIGIDFTHESRLVGSQRRPALKTLCSSQKASRSKHISGLGVQSPVITFSRFSKETSWDFDEAIVKGKVVADRVLPFLLVLSEVRKARHDILVNFVECSHAQRRALNGHGDQRYVGIRRLNFVREVRLASRMHVLVYL